MKTRWSIIVLAVLGVVAALAAAVLSASLSAQQIQAAIPSGSNEITVLVAAKNLDAMAPVTAENIVEKTVQKRNVPESYFSESSQIIGKILIMPMLEGQAFGEQSFPADSTGLLLAAKLPPGKRAVNVSLSNYSAMDGLLYPGCSVDVLTYFRFNGSGKAGDAISTTLLQNVQVLGVENFTVVSNAEEAEKKTRTSSGRRGLMVTLLVDSKQAEALQLAMEHGTITLAMRNPGDTAEVNTDATLLNSGQLARLGEMLGTSVKESPEPIQIAKTDSAPAPNVEKVVGSADTGKTDTKTNVVAATNSFRQVPANSEPSIWTVDVLRGLSSQTRAFPAQD